MAVRRSNPHYIRFCPTRRYRLAARQRFARARSYHGAGLTGDAPYGLSSESRSDDSRRRGGVRDVRNFVLYFNIFCKISWLFLRIFNFIICILVYKIVTFIYLNQYSTALLRKAQEHNNKKSGILETSYGYNFQKKVRLWKAMKRS